MIAAWVAIAVGCGGETNGIADRTSAGSSPNAAPSPHQSKAVDQELTLEEPVAPGGRSLVAEAIGPRVSIFERPGSAAPIRSLPNPFDGAPLVFLVDRAQDEWLFVHLPVRPNGSRGWIRRSEVSLHEHRFRITVDLSEHRLTVIEGDRTILDEPAGIGTRDTPTPGGIYYTRRLVQPPNPSGPYGPFIYELSGFSNVLSSFAGGDGLIGIHGTNRPELLGKDVSHGCIRISNAGISKLARILPLGVPVDIRE